MLKHQTYEYLNDLSTEELSDIVHEELHKKQIDEDKFRAALDALEMRYKYEDNTFPPEVEKAANDYAEFHAVRSGKVIKWSTIGKAVAAAAAVLALVIATPSVLGNENPLRLVAEWTDTAFHLHGTNSGGEATVPEQKYATDNPGLQELYNAVTELGAGQPTVPTWIPEGYTLRELKIENEVSYAQVVALFTCGDKYISISYFKGVTPDLYKDPKAPEIYECNGREYYILTNYQIPTAIWTEGNFFCVISTNNANEILMQIVGLSEGGREK